MESIKNHYQQLFAKHGISPQAVQYSDKESHHKRLEVLLEIDSTLNSVIDFGCGLADLYEILANKGYSGTYLGLDFVPEFIEINQLKFSHPKCKFSVFDIENDALDVKADYVFLSGVFNNKTENNKVFMEETLKKMFTYCNKGIAFNAMSTYVDYQEDHLFYINPLEVFDFCKKNLSNKVTLRHDYVTKKGGFPFEFCIYVYRDFI